MGISRATYYYRPKKNIEKRKRDADIADTIEAICYEHPYYGYRRITAALRKGMVVNHKKVAKMMKKMGLQCRKARIFAITTNLKHGLKVYPNLAKDLVIEKTGKLWCADITYIRILTGFVYLSALIDVFSRYIVGYAIGRSLVAKLPLEALKMAIRARNTDNLIHHSDKGIQYCSYEYVKMIECK